MSLKTVGGIKGRQRLIRLQGIGFIDDGGVDDIHHQPALAKIRGNENYTIRDREFRLIKTGRLSGGRLFDPSIPGETGLLAVERRKRSATGCPKKYAPLERPTSRKKI